MNAKRKWNVTGVDVLQQMLVTVSHSELALYEYDRIKQVFELSTSGKVKEGIELLQLT